MRVMENKEERMMTIRNIPVTLTMHKVPRTNRNKFIIISDPNGVEIFTPSKEMILKYRVINKNKGTENKIIGREILRKEDYEKK